MPYDLLAPSANAYNAGYRAFMLLQLRGTDNKNAMDRYFRDGVLAPLEASVISTDRQECPAFYFGKAGSDTLLFIDGIRTRQQGVAIWNGYTGNALNTLGGALHPWYEAAADRIVSLINNYIPAGQNLYVSGWSAGGAIAWTVVRKLRALGRLNVAYIIHFGSPKVFRSSSEFFTPEMCGNVDSTHFMNADDPVPFIPPAPAFWPRVCAGLTIFQSARLGNWTGYPNGVNIRQTLTLTPGNMPIDNTAPATSAIGTWLEQVANGTLSPHAIEVYHARLLAAAPEPTTAPVNAPRHNAPAPAAPLSNVELRRIEQQNVELAFLDSSRQNARQAIIPSEALFQKRKVGKIWVVDFGGVQVAVAPKKKRAAALARLGNAFLHKLQNEAQVSAADLATQFITYLALAQEPAAGFVPLLNTEL